MPGLFINNPDTSEGKYMLVRRDGTIVTKPFFAFLASDETAPSAIRAAADKARKLKWDTEYTDDLYELADSFEQWLEDNPELVGDPTSPPHREDNPVIIEKMKLAKGR